MSSGDITGVTGGTGVDLVLQLFQGESLEWEGVSLRSVFIDDQ